jgi:hypothetical protein
MTTYQLSPRVCLERGDKFRVSGGPYYRLPGGAKIPMAARGVFVLVEVEHDRSRVYLLGYGAGGYSLLHVAGRRRSRMPGLVCRPYRVRRVAAKKNPRAQKNSA